MMRKSLIIITILLVLAVVGRLLWVERSKNLKAGLSTQEYVTKSQKLAQIIQKKWFSGGNVREISQCTSLNLISKQVAQKFSRCNEEFLACYLKKNPIRLGNEEFLFISLDNLGLTLKSKESYRFRLDDRCHMAYLPKSFQAAGKKSDQKKLWDNFHEDIYIDKYYVSNYAVRKWKQDESIPANNEAYLTNSIEEAQSYCESKGKTLLESRYFDAASVEAKKDPRSDFIFKSDFHFKRGRTFLTSREKLTKKNCRNAYVKGCEKLFPFHNYDTVAQTWIGINYALGGHEELFLNRFNSEKNIKVSSMSLPRESQMHKLGVRGALDNKKGAFRCMLRL